MGILVWEALSFRPCTHWKAFRVHVSPLVDAYPCDEPCAGRTFSPRRYPCSHLDAPIAGPAHHIGRDLFGGGRGISAAPAIYQFRRGDAGALEHYHRSFGGVIPTP